MRISERINTLSRISDLINFFLQKSIETSVFARDYFYSHKLLFIHQSVSPLSDQIVGPEYFLLVDLQTLLL